jgi:hypothetical protein
VFLLVNIAEQVHHQRFLSLQNEGANPSDDMEDLRKPVDKCLSSDMMSIEKSPELWTEFLVTYATILSGKQGFLVPIAAPYFRRLIKKGLITLGDVKEATDDLLASTDPPNRFNTILPTLRTVLLQQKSQDGLLLDNDIDTNSRLWVARKPTVAGEITKIEYKTVTINRIVWEIGTHDMNNLAKADELQELSQVSQDVDITLDFFTQDVQTQFHTGLLTRLIAQIDSKTYAAGLGDIYQLSGYGGNRGEMIFQQAVYPPISQVMLAATSDATGKAYTYIANQEAVGSAFVVYDGQQYTVTGQLDSGLLMATSKDPIALLELKSQDELNHQDLAKCILWSSIAGQALVRAGVPRAQVRVPFLIGSGLHVSLFVTEFSDDDEFCPTARCMLDRLTLQSQKNAKKVFVALVLLLGRLKIEIGKLPDDGERILRERRKSKQVISRNVLSKRLQSDDVPNARALALDRREFEETHETVDANENETMAMAAVMKFCPETLHLAYP